MQHYIDRPPGSNFPKLSAEDVAVFDEPALERGLRGAEVRPGVVGAPTVVEARISELRSRAYATPQGGRWTAPFEFDIVSRGD